MNEFFGLREKLYHKRKEYMLAKLLKDCTTLENKVRFILGVVNEEIKINKVKRKIIVQTLKAMGFKTKSEIDTILKETKKVTVVLNDD